MRLKKITHLILGAAIALPVFNLVWGAGPVNNTMLSGSSQPEPLLPDTPEVNLHYPFNDRITDRYSNEFDESPMYGSDPSNIQSTVEYDPDNQEYIINERMGRLFYRNPSYMTFQEYVDDQYNKTTKDYWKQRSGEEALVDRKPLIPKLYVSGQLFDRIFGGNTVDIRPQGSAELTFGANIQKNENPAIPEKQRKNTNFDFKEKIQLNVIGNIGEKLKIGFNYNTEASFDFENKMKLEYTGNEDEIIQKIEAGNVTLPLTGTLIQGSQSLFGIKAALKFGHLTVTSIFSQQKGKASTIDVAPGGAQTQTFDIQADQYEANKHYFLSQYFKDAYDGALSNLPIVRSNVTISKVEVWVTNTNYSYENTRNVVAFLDLGELNYANKGGFIQPQNLSVYPDDSVNSLYQNLNSQPWVQIRDSNVSNTVFQDLNSVQNIAPGRDYERINGARKLNPTEYSLNATLGYISLNTTLNPDQVLAVAYEYTVNGNVYRVGDLTTSGIEPPRALFIKLLKSQNVTLKLTMPGASVIENPLWDLMMKNIYSLFSYQIQRDKFKLDVLYTDDATGSAINFMPVPASENLLTGKSLIKVFNLDKSNTNNDPQPDGIFDFVEGITINSANGRIIFPVREPFGSYLRTRFVDQTLANFYSYDALYDSTKTAAQQQPEKNKFSMRGTYQSSSSSEISLNAINIPLGSVKVTAGGTVLVENQDYTVDYNLGRVKIINAGLLNSGTPLQISLESNSLFNIQTKTLWGTHLDYQVSKDFILGGTLLHLGERPVTQKVNVGDEPISNTVWGVDGTWKSESRLLTRLVDKLPLISTKDPSQVTVSGEFAQLIPGNARAIGKNGTSYLDDFEGSQSAIDLRSPGSWYIASTPQLQKTLFPEADLANYGKLDFGKNRARMAWYTIDPSVFYRSNNITPPNLSDQELSNNNVREWFEKDIFPYKSVVANIATTISILNLAYYPTERGAYNYDLDIDANGSLLNPQKRWGGMMRRLETSDFEAANVEYIQFWMMDPFNSDNPNQSNSGDLYFNLGNVSEDVCNDGYKSFENGLPTTIINSPTVTTAWGVIPTSQTIVNAFDNDPASRTQQDVGFDGLIDANERDFFKINFLDSIAALFGTASEAYLKAAADPSSDDFNYYRDENKFDSPEAGILTRYKRFNGMEGNSPTSSGSFTAASTTVPDNEDINRDNGINTSENYYQYRVKIDKNNLAIGKNYITDIVSTNTKCRDGSFKDVDWYQFKIPIRDAQAQNIGDIQDFKSIRFIRMFMRGFSDSLVLRFARLELLRGEWRKCPYDLRHPFESLGTDPAVQFDIGTVNLEENGKKVPIPYVLPPGIDRELNQGSTSVQQLNEQSLTLKVCNLEDGDARAGYKNLQFDIRQYKKLKMYVHAENLSSTLTLNKGDLSVFIRIGTDFNNNFYEYEIPVTPTELTAGSDPYKIWPLDNNIEIDLGELVSSKIKRDNSGASVLSLYQAIKTPKYSIYIAGNPNLSNVRTILIGVRNVKKDNVTNPTDDGLPKCAEIWVNELRLTDFDNKGGWAANARVVTRLANLGTVSLSGSKSTYGWGSIEKKLNERSKEDITQYSVSSNMEIGKFLPDKSGISVPMYIDYAEIISKPQYDPLNPDVLFKDALNAAENNEQKKQIKQRAEDYTRRKSVNFTNVKKNKTKASAKAHVYDIENVSLTYAYSEIYRRNINTQYDVLRNHHGGLGYNFNNQPKNVAPFSKAKFLGNSKYLKLIKDINFYFMPSSINFRTDIDRIYGESLQRNNTDYTAILDTNFNKSFQWNRNYDLKFDLTKSLKFDFNATNLSRIDEPPGRIDTKLEKDSVRKNFLRFGRNLTYHQGGNLSYALPLNKFPLTDWISANARYGFDYSWQAGPLAFDSAKAGFGQSGLANTIQNSNTQQLNTTFTLTSLYNKVPFFKKVLGPKLQPVKKAPVKTVVPMDSSKAVNDTIKAKKGEKKKKEKKPGQINPVVRALVKAILGVKNASFTYSKTYGTLMPGYKPNSEILGSNWGINAPGAPFVFGYQDDNFPIRAARNGWLTGDTIFNAQYTKTYLNNFSGRASIEPIDGLRIELNANRNYSNNVSENFRAEASGEYNAFNHLESGNFSISYLTLSTSFINDNKDYSSEVFKRFATNRLEISKRLAADNINSNGTVNDSGFVDGYGATSQEVLTVAFLSAYSGTSPGKIKLSAFPQIPLPNWRVTYDGLSKINLFKKLFQSVSLSHAYRSTYSVNSYSTNLNYNKEGTARDASNNFIAKYEIAQVSISEQFSPLIGIDITWKNSLTTRFEYKKDRNLSLTYTGIQLTEVKGTELVIGLGYRVPKFKLPFKINGKVVKLNNDLNLTGDFGIRKDNTIVRKMQEQTNQPTAGLKITTIKIAADYAVNERLNVRAFFDKTINKPVVSTSFPTANTQIGITIRFTLAQ